MLKPFSLLFKLILLIIIPFILLIRFAVYLHVSSNLLPWVCILGSTFVTIVLLFIYLTFLHAYTTNYASNDRFTLRRRTFISVFVVMLYVIHGIFYISSNNLKSPAVRQEIRKVHPILRLAASTLMHLDKDLLITDSNRLPEDYKKMGLKSIKNSLHYRQSTGYAHAIDLRVNDRPEWKNLLVRSYFFVMGFRTLRHLGTADHLHISLMSHDQPQAK